MHLLHLVGATTDRFAHDLSLTYHAGTVTPSGMDVSVLEVRPDGAVLWGEGAGPRAVVSRGEALDRAARCDACVPFMFCPSGMTSWRTTLEDVIGLPVVGPSGHAIALATSKARTKAIARGAGVATPKAAALCDDTACPALPAIVKPDAEDNSLGLSLVTDPADWEEAKARALAMGSALVETYVPGREVRVGVIEDASGTPRILPVLEYHVSEDHPIRLPEDKVARDAQGAVTMQSWERPSLETSCPATLDPRTRAALSEAALTLHAALGCRDYSLYDFRIDAEGKPWLLEACIFWTFAPFSIISRMLTTEGADLGGVATDLFTRTAARRARPQALAAE